jgi:hypothetical protein
LLTRYLLNYGVHLEKVFLNRKLKSRHRRTKTESSKLEMKKAEKEYKKLLDTSIINHKESNETKDEGIKVEK